MARETAAPPPALQAELARLAEDVLPLWAGAGVTAALVRELPPVPAVLQHNDLGCWNVVVGPSGFTSVDWESAREHGLPLWDLVYFLTDALATLAGAASPGAQDELSVELLRGDSSRSPFLFGWVERAVRDLQIPREAVGPIVTLGWLHHGLSHRTRATALRRAGGGEPASPGPLGRLARIWLTDPALGMDWRAWRDA
jgi:hypothetical protein